jgi:hypothetical protein
VTLLLDGAVAVGDADIFVVGTKVSDFKMLNHEQLNSVAIGAIKAQQRRIASLESAVASIRTSLKL